MRQLKLKPFLSSVAAAVIFASAAVQASTPNNIVQALRSDGRFTTLLAALDAAGLNSTVATGGTFTVFAPPDAAFAALPPGTVASLIANKPALTKVLLYHAVNGEKDSRTLLEEREVPTLEGADLFVQLRRGGNVFVNRARVIHANVAASNGIAHMIDGVLLPPTRAEDSDDDSSDRRD